MIIHLIVTLCYVASSLVLLYYDSKYIFTNDPIAKQRADTANVESNFVLLAAYIVMAYILIPITNPEEENAPAIQMMAGLPKERRFTNEGVPIVKAFDQEDVT